MGALFQSIKKIKWVFFALISWLIICQLLFVMIQNGIGQKVVDSVENQLRQELDFSDFHYLARSITDYNAKGAIKCAKIIKVHPENLAVLDLKYMSPSCTTNSYLLDGLEYNVELRALNGDLYRFEFIALNPFLFYLALWSFRLIGVLLLLLTFKLFKLKEEKNKILIALEKNIAAATISQAQQVAHDIRSPLSALNLMLPSMNILPEDNRIIIRQAIQRINDIANDLLNKKNDPSKILNTNKNSKPSPMEKTTVGNSVATSIFLLAPVVDEIISEKRIQFRDRINVQIEIDLSNSYGLFINFNLTELKRIISNLINNSVEALTNNAGKIEVNVLNQNNTVLIQIKDNGKGIPLHILNTLGQRGLSYQKENNPQSGSGLGLYHAKTTIEQLGGKFEIFSEVGFGTSININISSADSPDWYLKKINLPENTSVVSVDDDVSIHGIWRNRFSSLQNLKNNSDNNSENRSKNNSEIFAAPIVFLSFTSTNEFIDWFNTQESTKTYNCIFLIDYEFINQKINGLELIEKLNLHLHLSPKTMLVTSRYDDPNIQARCRKLNIKLIPKSMAGLIPIAIEKYKIKFDWILIDDDTLVQQTWNMQAREMNVKFIGFLNFNEFKRNEDLFDSDSTIYIDSMLGRDSVGVQIKGEHLAEEIFLSGFRHIYITTGHNADFIQKNKYIKGVLGKAPPGSI